MCSEQHCWWIQGLPSNCVLQTFVIVCCWYFYIPLYFLTGKCAAFGFNNSVVCVPMTCTGPSAPTPVSISSAQCTLSTCTCVCVYSLSSAIAGCWYTLILIVTSVVCSVRDILIFVRHVLLKILIFAWHQKLSLLQRFNDLGPSCRRPLHSITLLINLFYVPLDKSCLES